MTTAILGSITLLIVAGLLRTWDAFKAYRHRAWSLVRATKDL